MARKHFAPTDHRTDKMTWCPIGLRWQASEKRQTTDDKGFFNSVGCVAWPPGWYKGNKKWYGIPGDGIRQRRDGIGWSLLCPGDGSGGRQDGSDPPGMAVGRKEMAVRWQLLQKCMALSRDCIGRKRDCIAVTFASNVSLPRSRPHRQ